jgi:hypothetical protein
MGTELRRKNGKARRRRFYKKFLIFSMGPCTGSVKIRKKCSA